MSSKGGSVGTKNAYCINTQTFPYLKNMLLSRIFSLGVSITRGINTERKVYIMTNVSRFIPDPEQAVLVVVDIQERLVPAMPENVWEKVLRNTEILIKGIREFDIPIILLEQYPEGLGSTVDEIKELLLDLEPIKKVAFNCCDVLEFVESLETIARRDVILCGMETHICILQSALGLLEMDHRVFVAADAVCSRAKHNWEFGLSLMRDAGVTIGTTEIMLFLMSRTADTERFIKISRLVK